MRTGIRSLPLWCALGVLLHGASLVAQSSAEVFATRLTRFAGEAVDAKNFRGDGRVQARIAGDRVIVRGEFHGLSSPARRARVFQGSAVGVPGKPVFDLAVAAASEGAVSGELRVTAEQLRALRAASLYVQIDTVAAPDGALWGWLLPQHEFPGANVPEPRPAFTGGL